MAKFPEHDGAFQPLEYQSLGEKVQLVKDSRGFWLWRSETSGDSFSATGYHTVFEALAAHVRFLARRHVTARGPRRPLPRATLQGRLPLRPDVEQVTYHRPPTPAETRQGYGATHYRDFPVAEIVHPGTRIAKRWFIARDDGLRYYR